MSFFMFTFVKRMDALLFVPEQADGSSKCDKVSKIKIGI